MSRMSHPHRQRHERDTIELGSRAASSLAAENFAIDYPYVRLTALRVNREAVVIRAVHATRRPQPEPAF